MRQAGRPGSPLSGPVDNPRNCGHHGNVMARSRVVVVKAAASPLSGTAVDPEKVGRLLRRGFELLTGIPGAREGLMSVFRPGDSVGIKVNTIGGRALSTRPETAAALAAHLAGNGLDAGNLIVWDRTNRELRAAGYKLTTARGSVRVYGTDADEAGYGRDLVTHLSIGSLFSTIQAETVGASISLAILKDHGMAGITAGMKNYFGAIHNPNKYHDTRCDPYVAEVFDAPQVRTKHRLSVIDALVVQYHRGPSFHPQWAEPCGKFIFSLDPVAADRVGWALVEGLRAAKGLPTLAEEGREPAYLATAARMGLGRADLEEIDVVEETVP